MSKQPENEKQRRLVQCKRLLAATQKLVADASLTGVGSGSEARCIKQFNHILQVVGYQISDGLIEPLDDDAAFGEIGIACSHLLSLLDEDSASESKTEEEERETYKSAEQTKEQAKEDAKKSKDLFENLSSFFDQEFSDAFRDLGGKVRDNIPQVIKDKVAEELRRAAEELKKAEEQLKGKHQSEQAQYTEIIVEDEPADISSGSDKETSSGNTSEAN